MKIDNEVNANVYEKQQFISNQRTLNLKKFEISRCWRKTQKQKKTQILKKVKEWKFQLVLEPPNNELYSMQIDGDLLITTEGFRLCYALYHLCLGCPQSTGEQIEYNKDIDCCNVKLRPCGQISKCSIEEAITIADKINCQMNLGELFEKFRDRKEYLKNEIIKQMFTSEIFDIRDKEFVLFMQQCFEYLKIMNNQKCQQKKEAKNIISFINNDLSLDKNDDNKLTQNIENEGQGNLLHSQNENQTQNPSSDLNNSDQKILSLEQFQDWNEKIQQICNKNLGMYSYAIGRVNLRKKDVEIVNYGFSTSYLDFLGIEKENLVSLSLRNKQIDLITNSIDITNFSAERLNSRIANHPICEQISYITTFDGFPIKISQKSTHYNSNLEFLFLVTEIDVDIADLQNLISYRHQLANNPHSLSMDNFLRKELSYKFEDIEYSIHSEEFMNKYYSDNLEGLKIIEKRKEISKPTKQCTFKEFKQDQKNLKSIFSVTPQS